MLTLAVGTCISPDLNSSFRKADNFAPSLALLRHSPLYVFIMLRTLFMHSDATTALPCSLLNHSDRNPGFSCYLERKVSSSITSSLLRWNPEGNTNFEGPCMFAQSIPLLSRVGLIQLTLNVSLSMESRAAGSAFNSLHFFSILWRFFTRPAGSAEAGYRRLNQDDAWNKHYTYNDTWYRAAWIEK